MSKVKFEYNLTKDAYNYAKIILFSVPHGISKNLDLIPKEIQEEVKKLYELYPVSHSRLIEGSPHKIFEPVISYLKNKFEDKDIKYKKKILEAGWEKIEKEYFQFLSELLQKPIYPADYTCYLTTLYSCPCFEKGNWFMVSAFSSLPNQIYVVCHEFMHLQFMHWYKEYCMEKGLTDKELWHTKEAITFLLNEPEFNNIIKFQDKGYTIHQELREKLKILWRKDKDFEKFLNEIISNKQDYFLTCSG